MYMNKSLAVLMTTYNRKEITLKCLSILFEQELPESVDLFVYLVDDASQDGTRESVVKCFPDVNIICGNGSLYWNGGMRLAFETALNKEHDFFLWLNDDTHLYQGAIKRLFIEVEKNEARGYADSIIVGATQDPHDGTLTYGGLNRYSWWYPLKINCVPPGNSSKPVDTINGNFALIPYKVAKEVGNLNPQFIHHLGDLDYGFRATQKGFTIWLMPGYVGTCSAHMPEWREKGLSFQERFSRINDPKGLMFSEWKIFSKKHAGSFWVVYWLVPYIKIYLDSIFDVFSDLKLRS